MTDVILDTSALQALLLGEPGADKVANIIDRARMSVVNDRAWESVATAVGVEVTLIR